MNIDEYESGGRTLYAEFCETVAKLLEQAIQGTQEYRLQHIQSRAINPFSLRTRLEEENAIDSEEIETLRKDLTGCHILFYTNTDVNRLANSGLLSDLFDIDRKRSKIHQPGLDRQDARDLFQSWNYVVRLKGGRTALAEYAPKDGGLRKRSPCGSSTTASPWQWS